jgi:hypothetical protein
MPAAKTKTKGTRDTSKIQFFGEVDLNKDGQITSQVPAWYLGPHIDAMETGIRRKEMQIERGAVESDQVPRLKAEIKRERTKLEAIKSSKPILTDAQKDRCASTYKSLGEQIKDTMPTRKETRQGLVNPHDELDRLKGKKHIKIDTQLAAACGVKPVHGKITGDEANKCYKILGKALGENTNVERLRKDGGHPAQESIHELTKLILDGREARGT